jgi:hypothetical protein
MEIWVLFAVAAAATQALRTAVQRRMVAPLGSYGAAYIRFSYACPIAWLCLVFYIGMTGASLARIAVCFLGLDQYCRADAGYFYDSSSSAFQPPVFCCRRCLFKNRSFADSNL